MGEVEKLKTSLEAENTHFQESIKTQNKNQESLGAILCYKWELRSLRQQKFRDTLCILQGVYGKVSWSFPNNRQITGIYYYFEAHQQHASGRGEAAFHVQLLNMSTYFTVQHRPLKVTSTSIIVRKNENQHSLNIWCESCQALLEGKDVEKEKVIKIKNKPLSYGIDNSQMKLI